MSSFISTISNSISLLKPFDHDEQVQECHWYVFYSISGWSPCRKACGGSWDIFNSFMHKMSEELWRRTDKGMIWTENKHKLATKLFEYGVSLLAWVFCSYTLLFIWTGPIAHFFESLCTCCCCSCWLLCWYWFIGTIISFECWRNT